MFHSCLKRTVMTTAVCLLVNYISVGANLYCTSTGWIEANPDGGEENLNSDWEWRRIVYFGCSTCIFAICVYRFVA